MVFKTEEVEVEKVVYAEKQVNKIVTMEEIEEVERKYAVPVVNTQY